MICREMWSKPKRNKGKPMLLGKGCIMFHVFGEGEIWVKMHKPTKKKSLLVNWEGFYFFLGYKDGKGIQK